MRPLAYGEPAYKVRVERTDYAGKQQHFEFYDYGLLAELLADIQTEAEKRGWFEDTQA